MKITKGIVPGRFVKRLNRFLALVDVKGSPAFAHVPNSGRLRELFIPHIKVFLSEERRGGRKTPYDLIMVELNGRLVSCDARLPNFIIQEALEAQAISEIRNYRTIRREASFGDHRLDFLLTGGNRPWLIEVKSVTLVENSTGLFPDAPTIRGSEHVKRLIKATKDGYWTAIIFVVQRDDATSFAPNDAQDPVFGETLRKACRAGVKVLAYNCQVKPEEITLHERLRVDMGKSL